LQGYLALCLPPRTFVFQLFPCPCSAKAVVVRDWAPRDTYSIYFPFWRTSAVPARIRQKSSRLFGDNHNLSTRSLHLPPSLVMIAPFSSAQLVCFHDVLHHILVPPLLSDVLPFVMLVADGGVFQTLHLVSFPFYVRPGCASLVPALFISAFLFFCQFETATWE